MAHVNFHSPTHALLTKEMKPLSKKFTVVDYGCGEGELLHYLPIDQIKEYWGFEVNKPCIPVARKTWKKHKQLHFDEIISQKLPSLGKKNSLDFLFLVGVVQYLPEKDLTHVLNEAKRVLKPGGQLLISCTTDHWLYSWLNIYRLFLPHNAVNRATLLGKIKKNRLRVEKQYERGLALTPLFSNIIVFFFDAADKVLFRTKGELGPIGRTIRQIWAPIIKWEFTWPLDYGYTLFVVASK